MSQNTCYTKDKHDVLGACGIWKTLSQLISDTLLDLRYVGSVF